MKDYLTVVLVRHVSFYQCRQWPALGSYPLPCFTETDLRADLVVGNPSVSILLSIYRTFAVDSLATGVSLANKLQSISFYPCVLEPFKVCLRANPALVPEVMSSSYLPSLSGVLAFLSMIMFWLGQR